MRARRYAGSFACALFATIALTTAAASASKIYAMQGNTTVSVYDTVANTYTDVAVVSPPAAATLQDLAEEENGMLYFIDNNGELWSLNPATPTVAPTDVGNTGLGTSPARLAVDSLGRLVTMDQASTMLIYINPATAQTTSTVALTGAPGGGAGGDIAIAQNGQVFEATGTQLLTFSPLGGPITTLSTADGATNSITAVAFDPLSGVLYGGQTGGPPSSIYTFNQTTGQATLFNTINAGGTINDFASLPTYPDLSVTKTHTGNFTIGQTGATYQITVKNIGTFPTAGTITVDDTLPTGLTFNAATTSGTGWTCSEPTAPDVICTTTASIAAGGTAPAITLGVNVVGPAANVTNTVKVTGGGQPVILPVTIANDPTTVNAMAQLTVAKTGPATANQNGTVTYNVVVSNAGPSPANGTTVSDPVPSNITAVTTTCGAATGGAVCPASVAAGNTISTTVPTLPSGGSVTFTVTGTATTPGSLTNTATIAPPTGTTATAGSTLTSSQATTIAPVAKLTVLKTGTATANQNGSVTYTIVVSNTGPSAANGTTVNDPVPSNITGVTTTCGAVTGGAVCPTSIAAGNTISTTVPTLPSNGSVTFTVTGIGTTPGAITNTATIAPPSGTNADPASTLTSSQATTIAAAAKLTVVKTGTATVSQLGTVTYTVVVSNGGPAAANGTTVSDPVPANITNVTTTCGGATNGAVCPTSIAAGNTITTTVPTLPNGGSVTFTVTGTASTSGSITNTATIAPPSGVNAGTGSTLQSSQGTNIGPVANLTIAKTGPANAALNGLIAYQILVSNAGPSAANGAQFSDPIPNNLLIEGAPSCAVTSGAATCGTVTVTGQTVASTITTLPSGASVTFSVNVKPTVATTYTNTATIAPPTGTTSNNPPTSQVTTTVTATSGFTKTVRNVTTGETATTADTGKPGDTLEYVLTFTNTTGTTLTNFAVTDPTPTNTTFVSASCGTLPAGVTACGITKPAVGGTGNVVYSFTGSLANGGVGTFVLDVKIS